MLGGVTRFFRQFRRVRAASADVRRAHTLYEDGLYAEVAELLKHVRSESDRPGNNPFLFGAQATVRLRAATLLSMAAAKLGDTAVALDAIAEGRSLWAEIRDHVRPGSTRDRMVEWDNWAQRYSEHPDSQGTPLH